MTSRFIVSQPTDANAARITEIHVAAMDLNTLLHAQFPTPESIIALRKFLTIYTASQLTNPKSRMLVTRDAETDLVFTFVK